jgi:Transposase DDE domain group 1
LSKVGPSTQEGVVQATNPPLDVVVADDRLVSHAGVALLAELADRLGLSSSLDRFVGGRGRTGRHPLARVLRDLIVMLADGGDCLSDLRLLGGCSALLGPVASIPTAWRVLERLGQLGEDGLAALRAARAQMRARAWRAGARPPRRLILDLDATLLVAHTDRKQGAPAATSTHSGSTRCWPIWTAVTAEVVPLAVEFRRRSEGERVIRRHPPWWV